MAQRTLADLAKKMKDIDFTMLLTHTEAGQIAGRPMSNNGEVAYEGTSYYFALESTRTVSDIARDPKVALSFQGNKGLLGKPPFMMSIEGQATLIRDKTAFAKHWTKDLDHWFERGIDTPGLTLIQVRASRIHYWDGEDQGELAL